MFASIAEKTALHCNLCRGLLLQIYELVPIIHSLRAQRPARSEVIPPPINPRELQRKLNCPVCKYSMDTYLYGDGGNVYLDSCTDCSVIWLDNQELKRIVEAPTRQKRETYKTMWEQEGVRRNQQESYDKLDLWGQPSVLTADMGEFLEALFC